MNEDIKNINEEKLKEIGFDLLENTSNPIYFKNFALLHNNLFGKKPPVIALYKDKCYIGRFIQDSFLPKRQVYNIADIIYGLVELSVDCGKNHFAKNLRELIREQ